MIRPTRYDAVLFDLLTALLDSWSLWNEVAGDPDTGARWRHEYLSLTYASGAYQPYEGVVAQAARAQDLPASLATQLIDRWDELEPWPEAPGVLAELAKHTKVGVVTNCSEKLGRRAADKVNTLFDVLVTAETAQAYKPRPEPYQLALESLDLTADRVLFVAGSRYDIAGASQVGMPTWWHNRVHMDRGDMPVPLHEHDRLTPLLTAVVPVPSTSTTERENITS